MRRREFLASLAAASALSPARAGAQQKEKVHRLAVVDTMNPVTDLMVVTELPYYRGFFEKLQQLGFVEGRNLEIRRYSSEGHSERLDEMVTEVVNLRPDVIFVTSARLLLIFKRAATSVPVVGLMGDPVRLGIVASMARPGGNITGVAVDPGAEFYNKRLDLLKEAIPNISKVGVLVTQAYIGSLYGGAVTKEASRRAGIEIIFPIEALYWRENEYRAAFARMAGESVNGVAVSAINENWTYRRLIIALAKEFKLPAIYPDRIFVELGGLMSLGPDWLDLGRDCARVVAEIFNGANPANIPISQPTKYQIGLNLQTAKALGIEIPPAVLVQADKVIE